MKWNIKFCIHEANEKKIKIKLCKVVAERLRSIPFMDLKTADSEFFIHFFFRIGEKDCVHFIMHRITDIVARARDSFQFFVSIVRSVLHVHYHFAVQITGSIITLIFLFSVQDH